MMSHTTVNKVFIINLCFELSHMLLPTSFFVLIVVFSSSTLSNIEGVHSLAFASIAQFVYLVAQKINI